MHSYQSSLKSIALCYLIFALSATAPLFSQPTSTSQLSLTEKDTFVLIEDELSFLTDPSRELTLEQIQKLTFNSLDDYKIDLQSVYWYRFKIAHHTNAEVMSILFRGSDLTDVYIPSKSGYIHKTTGRFAPNNQVEFDVYESGLISIAIDSIDFSRPFYFNKHPMSDWGKVNLNNHPKVLVSDDHLFLDNYMLKYPKPNNTKIYLGIIFISFIFFLVNFIISKDRNFLNYGLYLLCVCAMFSIRIPYFYNLYNGIHPKLYFYIAQVFHVASCAAYVYFVDYFIDYKKLYPKVLRVSRGLLKSIAIFGVIYFGALLINAFFLLRFEFYYFFGISFTIIASWMFTYLILKKPPMIKKVILIGSLFLILGNALTYIFRDYMFFLNFAIGEIILFAGAVSIQNKLNEKKRLQGEFDLQTEQHQRKLLEELDTAKSTFFANISHEFRTPLSLIKGPIEDQLQEESLPLKERKNLKIAQSNTQRLESLVEELLALSKLESGTLKLYVQQGNLSNFIKALSASFDFASSEKQIDYQIDVEDSSMGDWFDREALHKILSNLLGNAFKYTPNNGTIKVDGKRQDDYYFFEVFNSGTYIPEEAQTEIFKRFYQTDPKNPGTGIGLSLTKELIELHKGTIEITSSPEIGTRFTVRIPVMPSYFESEQLLSGVMEESTLQNTIQLSSIALDSGLATPEDAPILLVIDDSEEIRNYITSLFESTFIVNTATNGNEGLRMALQTIPDIIICDVIMPIEDGFSFTEKIKSDELTAHIPVVLLTGKTEESDRLKGVQVGADAYITKPFSSQLLEVTLTNLLENRRKLQQRFSQEVILRPTDIAIKSADAKFLEKLQTLLDKELTNPEFSAATFSEAMGVSRMQLHRKLKALTGQSTTEFLRNKRLYLATRLLDEGTISISEIGYAVGFNDPSYFAKCFKKEYGCAPSAYKKA